ncbi:MAG: lipopolysaccharide assembly LapA domain-containing protein [Coxiella-like endosymbiont]|uniref:LapA family protein n=1 Tax=Coxiella-like endosymbiont TaxID=1592897 RepID=UPI00215A87B6|nr:LapA family protein [Coxiella-like endosymbiont]UVE59711.1 LapA family protein [Coxiella-like endosymbiont]
MRYVLYVFWIFIILLGITFSALNSQKITLNYYLDTQTIYLPLLILMTLLVGVILGMIAVLPSLLKNKQAARRLKSQVRRIEREVQNLRKIPIKDVH